MLSLSRLSSCLVLGAVLFAAGCAGDDSDDIALTEKPPVAFDGKPDSRFAAVWKTANGASTYTLKEDGGYTIEGKVQTPGGSFDNKSAGSWGAKDDVLLFKDEKGNVVPYRYALEGKKLKLTLTGSLKRETVLVRQ
jgi:hypothetical protein